MPESLTYKSFIEFNASSYLVIVKTINRFLWGYKKAFLFGSPVSETIKVSSFGLDWTTKQDI